jgi:hypothetical protein
MDGESFDRLSVVVHRLGERATRRGALGLILGGSLTGIGNLLAENAGAHKKNNKHNKNNKNKNKNCWGGRCSNNCWWGGCGNGGGQTCGGRICQNGWDCCNQSGVSVCVPNNYPVCCGNYSFSNGYSCCGGNGGACLGGINTCTGQFGTCCQPGWKHCYNGSSTCIPDYWDCDQFFYQSSQNAGISTESAESIPTSDPIAVPAGDWIELPQE